MYSQGLRVKRNCSEKNDFEKHKNKIRSWFQKTAYPKKVLDEDLVKVRFSDQEKTSSKKGKGISFVATYHPILQALNDIIKRKFNLLYIDSEVWFHFGVLLNLAAIKLEQKLSPLNPRLYHEAVVKNSVKFA